MGFKEAFDWGAHGRPYSLDITIPPLGAVFFKHRAE
jgi:1,4-alpha-glucan branching enzyme